MRLLIQRVKDLEIGNFKSDKVTLLIFVAIEKEDKNKDLKNIVEFLENLEVLSDHIFVEEKFTKKIKEVKPEIFLVSQITLLANFSSSGKINFDKAISFLEGEKIFNNFYQELKNKGYIVHCTSFGSYLEIKSTNIGPTNFLLII